MGANRVKRQRSPHLKAAFLAEFRRHGNLAQAAAAVGVDRTAPYKWLAGDTAFAAAFPDAEAEAAEHLEAEAHRRAVEGVQRKKFTSKGQPVIDPRTGEQYTEREFSDTLLIVLLKARAPQKYHETVRQELTGADGGPIQQVVFIPLVLRDDNGSLETPLLPGPSDRDRRTTGPEHTQDKATA